MSAFEVTCYEAWAAREAARHERRMQLVHGWFAESLGVESNCVRVTQTFPMTQETLASTKTHCRVVVLDTPTSTIYNTQQNEEFNVIAYDSPFGTNGIQAALRVGGHEVKIRPLNGKYEKGETREDVIRKNREAIGEALSKPRKP